MVPSASTVGARSWAPTPAVAAGNAPMEAFIAASIWSAVMAAAVVGAPADADPAAPPDERCSMAFMPASA